MTEEQLQKIAEDAESLSYDALDALQREITRRGLELPIVVPAAGGDEVEQRELITVRTFRDLPEALLAKGTLDSAGIESFLVDDNIVRMDWFWSNAVGGIKLRVKLEDADSADDVLRQPIPEGFEVEGIGNFQQPHCHKCNSLDTVFEELNEGIAYTGAYFSLPLPVHDKGWKCESCGYQWEDADEEAARQAGGF